MQILVITGPPYSGKGTQCEILKKKLNYKHISTGDRIRFERENNTEIGSVMNDYDNKGLLVPDQIMEKLVTQIMSENVNEKGIILDGYSRTSPQVDTLNSILTKRNLAISQVINFEVPNEELLICAKERAKNSTREDDKDESIHLKRIAIFEKDTRPAIAYLKTLIAVDDVDGIGSIQEITDRVADKLSLRK